MTEAKSPREIAREEAVRTAERLVTHSGGSVAPCTGCVDIIESVILSYAAERERLLADADEVIVAAYGEIPEHGIGDNRRRLITEAFGRFRLRSRPATEGK